LERKVIVISGPTCSGKTDLGIILAEKINGQIISADSRQFYKYLNIGTAKPKESDLKKIKHFLIDFLEPDEYFNSSMFEEKSLRIIDDIFRNKKSPIIVGGSGLYIKAVVDGIFDAPDADEEFRKELTGIKNKYGNEYLHNQLKLVDPESAAQIHPSYWKRVMRALEVFNQTGKPIGLLHKEYKRKTDLIFSQYGLMWERKMLYKNIDERVDKMIGMGLVEEVKNILKKYDKNLNALNTVGYKEIISYLNGENSLDRAIELIKRNTRHFAKRQLTWFRKDSRITWFEINTRKDLDKIADQIILNEGIDERQN
jgi:tRNA dimethylallyltransferase